MNTPTPPDRSVVARDRPGKALGLTLALALTWYGLLSLGLAWWDRVQERQWMVARQTVPLHAGEGHWQSGNWQLDLTLGPTPFVSQRPVQVVVRVTHAGHAVRHSHLAMRLKMPAMPSYDLAIRLTDRGGGTFAGHLDLPVCTGGSTDALLQIRCETAGRTLGSGFRFAIQPPAWRAGLRASP